MIGTFHSSDANYVDATVAGSLTISKAMPTVTVVGGTFTYDGLAHAAAASVTGVNGEILGPVTVTYNGAIDAPMNAGTYLVDVSFAGDGNYVPASGSATIVIDRATPTLTVVGGTFTYDGQPHPATVTLTGVNGELLGPVTVTYNGAIDAPMNAGTYLVDVSFAGDGNYVPASGSATIVIDRATPTLTVVGGTFTYDGQPHPATVTLTGVNGESLGPVTVTYNGAAQAPVNPGTYAVMAAFAGTSNFLPVSGTATVVINAVQYASPHELRYWVLHPNAWNVNSLNLGGYTYSKTELYVLLLAPSFGDARIILAKQLIVAKLNLAHGTDPAPIQSVVSHADGLLAGRGKISFFSGRVPMKSSLGRQMRHDAELLEEYNS